jgi:hypothetical protein
VQVDSFGNPLLCFVAGSTVEASFGLQAIDIGAGFVNGASSPYFRCTVQNWSTGLTAPPDSNGGWIAYNKYNGHFYGHNGTTWKQLDN